jgi:hypothetical protein
VKKHYRHENNCLNCGTILQGNFCHVCGQENLEIKEGFSHVMNHAVSDYFHFDHQFFHTIKPLLFKPGYLTVEYMAGRRMQYLHPIKTYIFISVIYFLLLFQSGHEVVKVTDHTKQVKSGKATDSIDNKIAKNPNIRNAAKKKILTQATPAQHPGINYKIGGKNIPHDGSFSNTNIVIDDSTYKEYLDKQNKLPASKRAGFIDRAISKKVLTYHEKYGKMAEEVFIEELKHNIPKMMFLLLPLAAVIIGITFRKNKKYYVEHLIYTFHLHSFIFLFLAIILLLQKIIPYGWGVISWLNWLAAIYVAWYLYSSLRVVYQRSKLRTITKMIGISFTYLFAFIFCFALVLILTAVI